MQRRVRKLLHGELMMTCRVNRGKRVSGSGPILEVEDAE